MLRNDLMTESHRMLTVALAAAGPLALTGFGLLPAAWLNRNGRRAARAGARVALAAFGLALASAASLLLTGTAAGEWPVVGPFHVGVYYDRLTAVMLVLVAFLLAVVTRFAVNYLAGEPAQGRFTKWLCLTGGAVLTLVISGNLVQFAVAWCATSWGLHQLLVFYPERPGAVLAARK